MVFAILHNDLPSGYSRRFEMTTTTLDRPKLFGMIALSLGFVTKEQLEDNLEIQRRFSVPVRLGEIMLARGVLRQDQIDEILNVQAASCKRAWQSRRCVRH